MVFNASFSLGLGAVACAGKVRTFATFQRGALLRFGFFGRNAAKSSLANLFPRFWGSKERTSAGVFRSVFFRSQAFKVFNAVVGFVAVDVVDMFRRIKRFKPTCRHNTMHQTLAPKMQVPIGSYDGRVRLELSENFSATRYGVQVVKKSVFDSGYGYANHVVPIRVATESSF